MALEQELTLTGAFVDATTAVIADRMIVLAVASRTTLAITGATSYGVGVAGNTSQFGGSLGIALGSNNIGVIGPTAFYANTPIRVTAAGGNFTAGRVRVVLYALAFNAPISVGADTLTLTWVIIGSIVIEFLVLIVFLVRVAWWLSQRFTLIDASFMTVGKDVAQLKADIGNDIAGRRAVADARTDIAQMKATMAEFRERIDRIEANEDGRKHA